MNYELNAQQLGFLFRIRHEASGQRVVVHAKMRPYKNREVIQLLKEKAGHMQQAKDDVDAWDMKEGNAIAGHDFFDKHCIEMKLNGKVLDKDQIARLDARYNIRNTVIDFGYNNISRYFDVADPDAALPKELEIDDIIGDAAIKVQFALTDENEQEQRVVIPMGYGYPTGADSIAWDRLQIQQGLRQGGFRVVYNHEALMTLSKRMLQFAFDEKEQVGFVLDGQPCTKANKQDWIDAIPYLFHRASLGFLFSKAERVNQGNG